MIIYCAATPFFLLHYCQPSTAMGRRICEVDNSDEISEKFPAFHRHRDFIATFVRRGVIGTDDNQHECGSHRVALSY